MPETRKPDVDGPAAAILHEIECGRRLLAAMSDTETALRSGSPGNELLGLVRIQNDAARRAAAASAARQIWISGEGSLERYLTEKKPADAPELRRLAREAASLRAEILRLAQRGRYLAQRNVEWTQAQMELLVDWLTRNGPTYRAPGTRPDWRRTPSLMDRTA